MLIGRSLGYLGWGVSAWGLGRSLQGPLGKFRNLKTAPGCVRTSCVCHPICAEVFFFSHQLHTLQAGWRDWVAVVSRNCYRMRHCGLPEDAQTASWSERATLVSGLHRAWRKPDDFLVPREHGQGALTTAARSHLWLSSVGAVW